MFLEEKSIIKNIRKGIYETFVVSLLILLFAVVLLNNPENFISVAIGVFSYVACVLGIIDLVIYFRTNPERRIFENRLFLGVLLICFGIVAFFEVNMLKDMVTILLGGYLLFQNSKRLELSVNLKQYTNRLWIYSLLCSLLNLLLAILFIVNPFHGVFPIHKYMSILLMIIEGIYFLQNILILLGVKEKDEKEEK